MKQVSPPREDPARETCSGAADANRRALVGGSVMGILASVIGSNGLGLAQAQTIAASGGPASDISDLWPEIDWIEDTTLRSQVIACWESAFRLSTLHPADLYSIPFSIKIPGCPVSFNAHKRCVAIVAYKSAKEMAGLFGAALPINLDVVLAGAILADVGKLLEYEMLNGKAVMSSHGRLVRHSVSGAHLALDAGLPDSVVHIVATHSGEGDLNERSTESWIVHHADFMCTDPFIAIAKKQLANR